MDYDVVLQRQRALIYAMRDELLDGGTLKQERILKIAKQNIRTFFKEEKQRDIQAISRYILDHLSYRLEKNFFQMSFRDEKSRKRYLLNLVKDGLAAQEERLGSREKMEEFIRIVTLQALDDAWVEQVDYLQQLQSAVTGRSVAQRNPVFEYQQEALESFRKMERTVLEDIIRNILLSNVYVDAEGKIQILLP